MMVFPHFSHLNNNKKLLKIKMYMFDTFYYSFHGLIPSELRYYKQNTVKMMLQMDGIPLCDGKDEQVEPKQLLLFGWGCDSRLFELLVQVNRQRLEDARAVGVIPL